MKIIILLLCMLGVTSSLCAKPNQNISKEQHEENCINLAKMARVFMKSKQNGVSILSSLETINTTIKDKPRAEILKLVVKDAYSQPSYSSPSVKEDQLNEFTAKYYIGCSEMYK